MKNMFVKIALFYIRILAKIQLKKINPVVIGVAGSSGKTSVARFIYLILKDKYKVKLGFGKNSETGIPLNILGISNDNYSFISWLKVFILAFIKVLFDFKKYDIYVCEMGIDGPFEPKNMSYLLKIVKPVVGVLTNISFEHSQYFDFLVTDENKKIREEKILDLIAGQESLILTKLKQSQLAVLNLDDDKSSQLKAKIIAKTLSVSADNKAADFFIKEIKTDLNSFKLSFVFDKKEYELVISQPLPNHYGYSLLLAIAACLNLKISVSEAVSALSTNFSLPKGRMSIFEGIKNTTIIDSSYNNATLEPVLDILEMVKKIGDKKRKLAILGDMRELGSVSEKQHLALAGKILQTLDTVILIGPLMEKYVSPILSKNNFEVYSFPNFTAAKERILEMVRENDLILVKSSQNTLFLERAVELLLKNPKDREKLCRRGEFWDKKRHESP
jgi:UDP-N-acetylmuramoyl-tripeptide--D-alanyl-D-alanine ligase